MEKFFDKEYLDRILTKINYYDKFRNLFLYRRYDNIDYGKKIGKLSFNNLFAAADNYTYSNQVEEGVFSNWTKTLNDENSNDEELFCAILEIFVWGGVLNGNVKSAIQLYKNKKLKTYIKQTKQHLGRNKILIKGLKNELVEESTHEIIWSSGWTKVYSFINNNILIYDSRVSAFLNYTLTFGDFTDEDLKNLKNVTKYLYNFQGAENRERLVDKTLYGLKNGNPSGFKGFNANLISSWVVQLLNEKLKLNKEVRSFERAFFMLGFDLKQIKNN